ncbi:MAG: hypothetical protein NC301_07130 [Bacteroides sp.]|nr:hypothetical protein [Bacteroides sp.]MCM1379144.1 hypothetical protein [Bacteroides sp.]MCM1445338.1 hypothetical protein [Prevotella sp.]
MKPRCLFFFWMCMLCVYTFAHPINNYKYLLLEQYDDVPEDVEKRFLKEFPKMGFTMVDNEAYSQFQNNEKKQTLIASYKLRGSGTCLLLLSLKNADGTVVYDDLQVGDSGFMSAKNDRQSAITQLFRELGKLNYHFEPDSIAN